MSHRNSPQPQPEPIRRIEAGPWAIELLPRAAYTARYLAIHSAVGFAFDSQRGIHAIGSDRLYPFNAMPNTLAFVPAGCDVTSESPIGGEYLRVIRTDGISLGGGHVFSNCVDRLATALALQMRNAFLHRSAEDDWEAWALALTERATNNKALAAPQQVHIIASRMRLLDEFIDAGLDGPLSVKEMAELLGLSEGYFMRVFRHATGKSPHSYLIDCRLAKARALILNPANTLAQIAHSCGFSSQAHMATTFKQRFGFSPGKLRKS